MLKKATALLLAIILVVSLPALAAADDRSSSFFASNSNSYYIVDSDTFEIGFVSHALDIMYELGATTIVIERSANGLTGWTSMVTYSASSNPHLLGKNVASYSSYITYNGTPGYYYRALITYYARNSRGATMDSLYTKSFRL